MMRFLGTMMAAMMRFLGAMMRFLGAVLGAILGAKMRFLGASLGAMLEFGRVLFMTMLGFWRGTFGALLRLTREGALLRFLEDVSGVMLESCSGISMATIGFWREIVREVLGFWWEISRAILRLMRNTINKYMAQAYPPLMVPDGTQSFNAKTISNMITRLKAIRGYYGDCEVCIYQGHSNDLDLDFVVKKAMTPDSCWCIQSELICLTSTSSRDLVPVLGVVNDGESQFIGIVLKYMPNGNLYEHLIGIYGILPWGRRVEIIARVSRGLAALHEEGFVLQTLSSTNILINEDWQGVIGDTVEAWHRDLPNPMMVVNYGYTDPAYAENPGTPEPCDDLYSLGIVIFEVILGRIGRRLQGELTLAQENQDIDPEMAIPDERLGLLGIDMNQPPNNIQFRLLFKLAQDCCLPRAQRIGWFAPRDATDAFLQP